MVGGGREPIPFGIIAVGGGPGGGGWPDGTQTGLTRGAAGLALTGEDRYWRLIPEQDSIHS